MRHLSFLALTCFLFIITGCETSEEVKGVDAGAIVVTNSTNNELSVSSGGTMNVEFRISPRENTTLQEYQTVTYTSTNPDIFEVGEEGLITGKRDGTARLIVSAFAGEHEVKGSCVVRVSGQIFVETINVDEALVDLRLNVEEASEFQILEEHYSVLPENALIREVTFASSSPSIASVDQNGLITAISGGATTISILSTDGSNVKAEIPVTVFAPIFTWYLEERRSFVFEYMPGLIQYPLNADGVWGNDWSYLIDEGSSWEASFINMSKPGRAMAPNAVVGDIFIPIDMQQELTFNMIYFRHRSSNTYARLRVWEFDLLGSDDGVNFYPLQEGIVIPGATVDGGGSVEATLILDNAYTARYIKIVPTDWDRTNGNSMQVSDLKIGYDESLDTRAGL